jgi:hypothetical protein
VEVVLGRRFITRPKEALGRLKRAAEAAVQT